MRSKSLTYLLGTAAAALIFPAAVQAQALATSQAPSHTAEQPSPDSSANDQGVGSDIIVTGTRFGSRARDSAAPITVLGAETLKSTGQNNVFDALQDIVPSFSSSPFYGTIVRSARLRGLPAGEILVLVNGKRRHNSAYVVYSGPDVGSNPVDLDFIPQDMIDHVELLQDGAAAQYGSDAIAGVMNFILKKNKGINIESTNGITTRGDGRQSDVAGDAGFDLGRGFVHLTASYRHQGFSVRDDGIPASYATSKVLGNPSTGQLFNRIQGHPDSDFYNFGYNAELPIDVGGHDLTLYADSTIGYRYARVYSNYRKASVLPQLYPEGFYPQQTLKEWDFGFTEGLKGSLSGNGTWDLSNTYGHDSQRQGIFDTANTGYYALNGSTQTSAFTGGQKSSQITTNLDVTKPVDIGLWAAPLNVAAGLEHRYETYIQSAGDPVSYLYGGTQAYAGFTPQSASSNSRNVVAAYVDLSTRPVPQWQLGVAGRFEHFSGIGSTVNGRLSTRYDFGRWLGIRGTFSTGFHAPTLAQQNYAIDNVSPVPGGGTGQAFSLLLPTTSSGAGVVGASALKPEKDTDITFGFVSNPARDLHASIDFYQIDIRNRIILTGAIGNGTNAVANSLALAAANANGFTVPSGSAASVNFFTNGANTRTRGIDISVDYKTDLDRFGSILWTLVGNVNQNKITKYYQPTGALASAGLSYFAPDSINFLTNANPGTKFSLAADYSLGDMVLTLRETRWGKVHNVLTYGSPLSYYDMLIPAAYTTDIQVAFQPVKAVKVSIGANNLFDKLPPETPLFTRSARNALAYPSFAPYGIDGTYIYGRVQLTF